MFPVSCYGVEIPLYMYDGTLMTIMCHAVHDLVQNGYKSQRTKQN